MDETEVSVRGMYSVGLVWTFYLLRSHVSSLA